jgi:hypothetical protein
MDEIDLDKVKILADLERIRSARVEPLQLRTDKAAVLDTTSEIIKTRKLRPGRIHVITNICLIETGQGTPQVFLGFLSKGEKYYLYSKTVTTAEDSVTWAGQAIALEFDEVFAELQSATATDTIILTVFGYSMRL